MKKLVCIIIWILFPAVLLAADPAKVVGSDSAAMDYWWPKTEAIPPALNAHLRYIKSSCEGYADFGYDIPTPQIQAMCDFEKLYEFRKVLMEKATQSEDGFMILPEDLTDEAIRAGVFSPKYDFSLKPKDAYGLMANLILIDSALYNTMEVIGKVFETWFGKRTHYEQFNAPVIKASLTPSYRLGYYLRASLETNCQSDYFVCDKISGYTKEETQQVLGHLVTRISKITNYIEGEDHTDLERLLKIRLAFLKTIGNLKNISFNATDMLGILTGKASHHAQDNFDNIKAALVKVNQDFVSLPSEKLIQVFIGLYRLSDLELVLDRIGATTGSLSQETEALAQKNPLLADVLSDIEWIDSAIAKAIKEEYPNHDNNN